MQRDIIELAARDARERAQRTAAAAGGRLGDILVIEEGSDACLGNWSSNQVARVVNPDGDYRYAPTMAPPSPPPPPPSPVASGQVGSRTITITERDLAALDLPSDPQPQQIQGSVCVIYTLVK
jgi:hypothetical protein